MTRIKPFALCAKVIIGDDQGRCLLLRRSAASKANKGKWDLPGGQVDSGEDFEEAVLETEWRRGGDGGWTCAGNALLTKGSTVGLCIRRIDPTEKIA